MLRQRRISGTGLRLGLLAVTVAVVGATFGQEPAVTTAPPLVTSLAEADRLTLDQVRQGGFTARLQGVVTFQSPDRAGWLFVQDGDHALQVFPEQPVPRFEPGRWVEVEGTLDTITFAITLVGARITDLGVGKLPEPAEASLADLDRGLFHGRYVRTRGAVLDLCTEYKRPMFLLSSLGTTYNVFVPETVEALPLDLWNGQVEATGVAFSRTNIGGEPSGFYLLCSAVADLRVTQPGSRDLFDRPLHTVRQVREIRQPTDERLRVAGIVTHVSPRNWFVVEDETGPITIQWLIPMPKNSRQGIYIPRTDRIPERGDTVDVVGSLNPGALFAPNLVRSEFRVTGQGPVPAPVGVTADEILTGNFDRLRVTIEARALEAELRSENGARVERLWLQSGDSTYSAVLLSPGKDSLPVRVGDSVRVTGLCVVTAGTEPWERRSFHIYLDQAADAVILGRPPIWLTHEVLTIGGGAIVLLLVALIWVRTLRRRVAARTAELAEANRELNGEVEEREVAQARLKEALAAERELGELKSRFVSLVSHEFRTPLGITMSAVELLRNYVDRLPPEKQTELLEDIHGATLRMSGLMEQVLLLGRVDAGRGQFRRAPLDLVQLGGKLVDEQLSATGRKCGIRFAPKGDLDSASGDESLLRHLFTNLLSNAVKYSEPGTEVEWTMERDGDQIVFQVRDHGVGIPEGDRARLFEAFHRGSNVGQTPGTGLGLLIVKRSVELHGGRIGVESEEGVGTTFTIWLPLCGKVPSLSGA